MVCERFKSDLGHPYMLVGLINPPMANLNQYVDMCTGTGKTALACIKQLAVQGDSPLIVLVDGLHEMVTIAMRKIWSTIHNGGMQTPLIAGVLEEQQGLRQKLLQGRETHLLTAQRVFLNSTFSQRALYLREWA